MWELTSFFKVLLPFPPNHISMYPAFGHNKNIIQIVTLPLTSYPYIIQVQTFRQDKIFLFLFINMLIIFPRTV